MRRNLMSLSWLLVCISFPWAVESSNLYVELAWARLSCGHGGSERFRRLKRWWRWRRWQRWRHRW